MSDDFVSELVEEQNNPNGLLLQILSSGYEEWSCIIAVEGPDDVPFYFDFITRHIVGETHFLRCGGKDALLKFKGVAEQYDWAHRPSILYLCDKDYDDYIGRMVDGVWYTEPYSIESFVACGRYVEYALKKHAGGALMPDARAEFILRFEQELASLVRRVRSYSAYACEVRANGEHPEFDEFGIDKLFVLRGGRADPAKDRLASAKRELGITSVVPFKRILARSRMFALDRWQGWLRGKLALQLARKSYERAIRSSPPEIQEVVPPGTVLGPEALRNAGLFLDDLPGLEDYCRRALQ